MPINHANEPQVPVVQQNVQQHAENPAIYQQTTYHQPAVTQPTQTHTEQHFDFPQNQTQMDFPGNQTQMDFPGTSTTQTLDFPGNSVWKIFFLDLNLSFDVTFTSFRSCTFFNDFSN